MMQMPNTIPSSEGTTDLHSLANDDSCTGIVRDGKPCTELLVIRFATEADRETIYRMRHDVYAVELGQHPTNSDARLTDPCDHNNLYLVARNGTCIVGFVSITLPGGVYSVDKYLSRESLPFPVTDTLYEVRLLTVPLEKRYGPAAQMLMYAALRVIEDRGGTHIMAIGRQALKPLYEKAGLEFLGIPIRSGAVDYEMMSGTVETLRMHLTPRMSTLRKLRRRCEWNLPISFDSDTPCAHGGQSFDAIGDHFQTLDRRYDIVAADVLDAWFPPAPGAIAVLQEHLPWMLQTSPPADSAGLIKAIATARGLPPENVAVGAGSSALIYLAFRQWLTPNSRVLLPDPTYGEYAHVLERVIGCRVDRVPLRASDNFRIDPDRLFEQIQRAAERGAPYDMVVLVNPNNPTGKHISRTVLENIAAKLPRQTLVWVDEAYIDYIGPEQSMESWAVLNDNMIVCKSLSKGLALSGARAAYLCGPRKLVRELRFLTPPWAISLPAQIAAVAALRDPGYYQSRYAQTAELRQMLARELYAAFPDWAIQTSPANWVICRLPTSGPGAAVVCARCRTHGVFLRDARSISSRLGTHTIRIAVKDVASNRRIVAALVLAMAEA